MARTTRRAGANAPAPTPEQEPSVADNETLEEENARLAGDNESPEAENLDEENERLGASDAEKVQLQVLDGPKPQVSPGGEESVNASNAQIFVNEAAKAEAEARMATLELERARAELAAKEAELNARIAQLEAQSELAAKAEALIPAPLSQEQVAAKFSPSAAYGGAPIVVSAEDYRMQLGVQAMEEAKVLGMDRTAPGGKYLIGDIWVDANGQPI